MSSARLKRDRELKWLPVDKIIPNERNPRKSGFSQSALAELRKSIENHGILEPVIVQPHTRGLYMLIEGERRWTVANQLGLKQIPAVIQPSKLEGDEQVVLMYNLHENRKGWEMADHLRAISELMKNRPEASEEELADELGISLATFRDRLQVMRMGDGVIQDIQRGNLDYTSALRSAQAARTIARKRPELAEQLGGTDQIEKQLVSKAKVSKGGLSHELLTGKRDLADTEHVPDELIKEYVEKPDVTLRDVRQQHQPARQSAAVNQIGKRVGALEETIRALAEDVDWSQATVAQLRQLHGALRSFAPIIDALERQVNDVILSKIAEEAKPPPPQRRQRRAKPAKETLQAEADQAAGRAAREEAEALVERVDRATQQTVKESVEDPQEAGTKRRRRRVSSKA